MKTVNAIAERVSTSFPVAVVVSCFNELITNALKEGALTRLEALGINAEDITLVEVPGAIEIPFVAQSLAKQGHVKVIITLGAVIRGETTHYDYVCDQVSQGCQRVMLDHGLPVIFGVLTTENDAQAWDRLGGNHGHKGREAADCAIIMHAIQQQLESSF